jgi:hypothetical protein
LADKWNKEKRRNIYMVEDQRERGGPHTFTWLKISEKEEDHTHIHAGDE